MATLLQAKSTISLVTAFLLPECLAWRRNTASKRSAVRMNFRLPKQVPIRDVSVVIPTFMGRQGLPELVERIQHTFRANDIDGEIIIVNDDSPDGSWECICELSQQHRNVRGYNLMRNYGQHGAALCGIRAATKSVIVTMDDDLQHRPESIPEMLTKINEGYDVVFAAAKKMPHPPWRNFLSVNWKRFLTWLIGRTAVLPPSAYIAFRQEVRQSFDNYRSPDVVLSLCFAWSSTRIATIYVDHDFRKYGETTYTLRKLFGMTMRMFTAYSIAPLRFASFIGFFFFLFGGAVTVYTMSIAFTQHTVPGFAFLASLVAIMGGAQLFALGMMGEYLALMYKRNLDRPAYVIRSTTAQTDDSVRPASTTLPG